MEEGGFQFYKWYSNILEVEVLFSVSGNVLVFIVSFVYVKIFGVFWNKIEDRFEIGFMKLLKEVNDNKLIKRKMLFVINGIFDLLGILVLVVIIGKVLYS